MKLNELAAELGLGRPELESVCAELGVPVPPGDTELTQEDIGALKAEVVANRIYDAVGAEIEEVDDDPFNTGFVRDLGAVTVAVGPHAVADRVCRCA